LCRQVFLTVKPGFTVFQINYKEKIHRFMDTIKQLFICLSLASLSGWDEGKGVKTITHHIEKYGKRRQVDRNAYSANECIAYNAQAK
jgi:hypothetical protein